MQGRVLHIHFQRGSISPFGFECNGIYLQIDYFPTDPFRNVPWPDKRVNILPERGDEIHGSQDGNKNDNQ